MIALWISVALAGPQLDAGVAALDSGDAPAAIAALEAVEAPASGRVHLALGIAWSRLDDAGRAIGHLRAAQRLRPRDGDAHHNLALVRSRLVGAARPAPSRPGWTALATVGEVGLAGLLAVILGTGVALRRRRLGPELALWGLGLGLATTSLAAAWEHMHHPVLVVVEPTAARATPRVDAATPFELVVGDEVRLAARAGPFLLVEDGDGRRGWVPDSVLYDAEGRLREIAPDDGVD